MQKQYKAIIVDDERLARKDLLLMLREFDNIEVVGEADSVTLALEIIRRKSPDIIFLDIQMPGESGFDLLEKAQTQAKIIFVTAFDEYAIRAFEVNAMDYLLKPISTERLTRTLERIELEEYPDNSQIRQLSYDDRLFLIVNSHLRFLKVKQIIYINAAGDYSEIFTSEGIKGLTQKTMKEWEMRLPETYFCRIHRSTIINMEYVDRLEDWFNYSLRIYLKGVDNPYVISRRYVSRLKERLG
ncbi:MAG: LytTR family DNA-binding domain-containing protein [Calditrichia bacterium]